MSIFFVWRSGGWVGVDLFFVLSGFLVSGLLFKEYKSRGRFSIGRFYVRRGWRIYPPFFVLIITTVIIGLGSGRLGPPRSIASEFFFLQSYVPGLWDHTWSLAVEEHFYLLLPLALTLMLPRDERAPARPRVWFGAGASVAVTVLALRVLNYHYRPQYTHITHLYATHLRLDSLFFGVMISYAYHFHPAWFTKVFTPWRRWLMLGGALLLTPAFAIKLETSAFILTAGLSLFYIASGMLLVGALLCTLPRRRPIALMATLGASSYSIYLWQLPVNAWGIRLVEMAWGATLGFGARTAVFVFGSLVVGFVMSRVVESPVLHLRDKVFP
jgi:peptidoglycan/LPS O-acetylase OafA/YrhL